MADYYVTGSVSLEKNSKNVIGIGTAWQVNNLVGGIIIVQTENGNVLPITNVIDNTHATSVLEWEGETGTYSYAFMRAGDWIRQLDENSSLLARIYAQLEAGTLFKYDVTGLTADKSNYDDRNKGFAFLDISNDPALLYVKKSSTSGDWAGPFGYARGPAGPAPVIIWGDPNDGAPGSTPTMDVVGDGSEEDPYVITFTIPAGEMGLYPSGDFDIGTTYRQYALVTSPDGSYISKFDGNIGHALPVYPASENTWWKALVMRAIPPNGSLVNAQLADAPTKTLKGRYDAGNGPVDDLTPNKIRGIIEVGSFAASSARNAIINGDFDMWQRAITQSVTGYGSDDRWRNNCVGSTIVHSRQAFPVGQTDVPGSPDFFSRTVVTSVAGAANNCGKVHLIEDVTEFADQFVTLSFWAKSDAARNIAIEFGQNFGSGGSPSAAVNGIGMQQVSLTTLWQKFSLLVYIPSIAGKVLGTGGNDNLQLVFWWEAGSNFDARTGGLGQQSGTFDLAHVSLVRGDATKEADPSGNKNLASLIASCKRFYHKHGVEKTFDYFAAGYCPTTTTFRGCYFLPVKMRAAPALSWGGNIRVTAVSSVALTALAADNPSTHSSGLTGTVASGLTAGQGATLNANSDATAWIAFDAEL